MIRHWLKSVTPGGLWNDLRYFRKWKLRHPGDWFRNITPRTLWVFLKIVLVERLTVQESLDTDPQLKLSIRSTPELPRLNSLKEPETVEWIKREVRPGDIFYDVGANVGAYSLLAAKQLKGHGMVYAFEPGYATFASLCQNIQVNKLESCVTPFSFALADRTYLAQFNYTNTQPGRANHSLADFASPRRSGITPRVYTQWTPVYRLDDLVNQFKLQPPTLLKIDVDGPELLVLHGASNILRIPTLRSVLIEVDRKIHGDQISDFMKHHGFQLDSTHQRGSHSLNNHIYVRT